MAKRESNEARIMRLYSELSDEGKRIIYELLKGQQVPVKRAVTRKRATPKVSTGDLSTAAELALKTGKSVQEAQKALDANAGDKKAAMLALTSQ